MSPKIITKAHSSTYTFQQRPSLQPASPRPCIQPHLLHHVPTARLMIISPERKEARSYDLNTEMLTIKDFVKSHINLVNFCFLTFWEKNFKKKHRAYVIYNKETHFFQMSADTFQVYPERVTQQP